MMILHDKIKLTTPDAPMVFASLLGFIVLDLLKPLC
jgi:hypothetical protein